MRGRAARRTAKVRRRRRGGRGCLPPLERRERRRRASRTATGLPPDASEYETADTRRRLRLEAVGQPTIAVGADRFGAAIGGGIGFCFSDMLGDQSLAMAFQINAGFSGNYSLNNTAAQAMYLNQRTAGTGAWSAVRCLT